METVQKKYLEIAEELKRQTWEFDEYRKELLLAAEGICMVAEMNGSLSGYEIERVTDTKAWLKNFREQWLKKNKESELYRLEEVFLYCEEQFD